MVAGANIARQILFQRMEKGNVVNHDGHRHRHLLFYLDMLRYWFYGMYVTWGSR